MLREIANLPSERKTWYLRKFYAGNGGCLPPTDPRILALTPEQIDLEFTHMILDKEAKETNKQVYVDDDYDNYDEESEKRDSRTSEIPRSLPKVENNDDEEWEDVDYEDDPSD